MISIKKLVICGVMTIPLMLVSVVSALPVNAADNDTSKYNVQISPPSQKVSLEPGTTYNGTFGVNNIGNEEFEYTVSATPFSVSGRDYRQDFDVRNTYNQMADWISIDDATGKVSPNESNTVHYTVKVPDDAPGGTQVASIAVSVNNKANSNIQTITRVAMILYAKIPGDVRETGEIKENNISSIVFGGNKITASSLISNTGNTYGDAKYIMKAFPFGSNEEVYTNEEDPLERTILPETERYNTLMWEDTPQLGLFTVEQTIEFMGKTSTTSKLVIVCPVWLIVIFVALILAIIFTIVTRARSRKQSKRESSTSRSHSESHDKSEDKE